MQQKFLPARITSIPRLRQHWIQALKLTDELDLGSVCLSYLCKINGTKTVQEHMKELDMKLEV